MLEIEGDHEGFSGELPLPEEKFQAYSRDRTYENLKIPGEFWAHLDRLDNGALLRIERAIRGAERLCSGQALNPGDWRDLAQLRALFKGMGTAAGLVRSDNTINRQDVAGFLRQFQAVAGQCRTVLEEEGQSYTTALKHVDRWSIYIQESESGLKAFTFLVLFGLVSVGSGGVSALLSLPLTLGVSSLLIAVAIDDLHRGVLKRLVKGGLCARFERAAGALVVGTMLDSALKDTEPEDTEPVPSPNQGGGCRDGILPAGPCMP